LSSAWTFVAGTNTVVAMRAAAKAKGRRKVENFELFIGNSSSVGTLWR
jgi:hypothetical protein